MTDEERLAKEKADVLHLATAMSAMDGALRRIRELERQLEYCDRTFEALQSNLGEKLMISSYREGQWRPTPIHKVIQSIREDIKKVLP